MPDFFIGAYRHFPKKSPAIFWKVAILALKLHDKKTMYSRKIIETQNREKQSFFTNKKRL